jgi:hypothetical protein
MSEEKELRSEQICYQDICIGLKPNGIDLYLYKAPKSITPDFSLGILGKKCPHPHPSKK